MGDMSAEAMEKREKGNLRVEPLHASFLLEVEKYLGGFREDEPLAGADISNFALIRGFIQGMISHSGYTAEAISDLPESPIKFK